MKKLIALLLTTVMCLSFVACGNDKSASDGGNNKHSGSKKETVASVETQAPTVGKEIPRLDQALSGSLGKSVTFVLDTDGKLTISGEGKMQSFDYEDGKVDTPWFEVREYIQTVVIEEGVTSISAHTLL